MIINLTSLILSGLTTQQKLSWGGNGLVIGLGSVFIILVILIAVINVLKLASKPPKDKQPAKAVETAKPAKTSETKHDENEIIAVIAAAINCMAAREGKRFAIKSYKRVGARTKRSY